MSHLGLDGHLKTIHSFGYTIDGRNPYARLIEVNGTLYGTTVAGGSYEYGTVYKIGLSGQEKVLYSFNIDGCPHARLTAVGDMLYGVSPGGDASPCDAVGAVFRISPTGDETTLHAFSTGKFGTGPSGTLVSTGGRLYGTTGGGSYGKGTVFSLQP